VTATLRVVLDQLVAPTRREFDEASYEIATALIATAPTGCDVAAIVPSPGLDDGRLPGLVDVLRLPLQRRELTASWQLGIAPGVGKGMIHSPTAVAPLVRHDRVNETHQMVVTMWDLRAWEAAAEMPRPEMMWHRGMLRRAEKHADAVVVPTHAMAARLEELGRFAGRVRVIAGAVPTGFRVPGDVIGRLRSLDLPESFVATSGGPGESDGLSAVFRGLAGVETDIVVLDCPEGMEPAVADLASAANVAESRVHVRGSLEPFDRAAVLGSARAFVAGSARSDWPWRAVEALAVGVAVVAVESDVHREVLADAAAFAPADELAAALTDALGDGGARLRVLSGDRAKAFSWREHAERVWALHADL
jgi:glycosyltransferase involved in cell wall biosynthesis